MCCVRTWVACLLMVLVPLQGAAAAAKFCCVVRGHLSHAVHNGVAEHESPNAHKSAIGPAALVHSAAVSAGQADASGTAECAICATLCHSIGITPTILQGQASHCADGRPGYAVKSVVSPSLALPDKPPRV